MEYRIKNNSNAPQGVYTDRGLVFIAAGAEKNLAATDIARVRRLDFMEVGEPDAGLPDVPKDLAARFDHDGDGKVGGSLKGAQSTRTKGRTRKGSTRRTKAPK